ncbi:MAG: precorrin-6y C5,15-methyltransferase (decarboxylating) subunit CbiE [Actinobacteria bacterium]|nr:precorrin-6y C5,15-methyltransferase (decarboxylating) subunit CbiE [Actinomycetota bacterium]
MVTVVGIGPGHPDYITPAAVKRIGEAQVLIGGKRVLEAVDRAGKEIHEATADIDSIIRTIEDNRDKNTVVLVSGDPGFYSMLQTIRRKSPHLPIDVVPGISSVQVLFSLIAQEWQDIAFTSVHGRAINELDKTIRDNKKICILTDDKITPAVIGRYLAALDINGRAVVGRNLSYPDQELIDTTIDKLAGLGGLEQCVLYVEVTDEQVTR